MLEHLATRMDDVLPTDDVEFIEQPPTPEPMKIVRELIEPAPFMFGENTQQRRANQPPHIRNRKLPRSQRKGYF